MMFRGYPIGRAGQATLAAGKLGERNQGIEWTTSDNPFNGTTYKSILILGSFATD
jgi:hypothetical protein